MPLHSSLDDKVRLCLKKKKKKKNGKGGRVVSITMKEELILSEKTGTWRLGLEDKLKLTFSMIKMEE